MRAKLSVFTLLALAFLAAVPNLTEAQPARAKLDRALRSASADPQERHRVIIRTKPGAREAWRQALQAHGRTVIAEHAVIDALTAEVYGADLDVLAGDPWIESVSIDAIVSASGKPAAKKPAAKTAPEPVNELRATLGVDQTSYTGAGVGIALIDSGIDETPELSGSVAAFFDFSTGSIVPTRPYDDYGHGTHLAGLIANNGQLSRGEYKGVAPDVRLIGLKVLDAEGRGYTSNVIRALEFAILTRRLLRIDVINLSLGHPIYEQADTDPLVLAVEKASAAGILVVVAAGNYGMNETTGEVGYGGITSPGNALSAITVGALMTNGTVTREDDRVAPYSSRGPTWYDARVKPDVVAPGHELVAEIGRQTTLYGRYPTLRVGSGSARQRYFKLSGTSLAAAVTSGVVALAVEANRQATGGAGGLSPNLAKALVQYTAFGTLDHDGRPADWLTQGAGALNGAGVVTVAGLLDTRAPQGEPWQISGLPTGHVTTIGAQDLAWGRNIVWGGAVFHDGTLLWSHHLAFDRNIVWGSNIVWGGRSLDDIVWGTAEDNIVWGTLLERNIVWGSNIVWSTNIVWGGRLLGLRLDDDNIVWGTADDDNIVWGTLNDDNIVWGTLRDDNIVWGTNDDNIVWGTSGNTTAWGGR